MKEDPPDMHDAYVLIEGRKMSTTVIPCSFCNRQRPSPCFYSYVYLDVRTFPMTFTEAMIDIGVLLAP